MKRIRNIFLGAFCTTVALLALRKNHNIMEVTAEQNPTLLNDKSLPRGYRNNNPLNIRISKNKWKGKVSVEYNTDGAFEQFVSLDYGYRAAFININTIIDRGNDTIEKIIRVWAPDSDGNNSQRYINFVCEKTGYQPDTVVDPLNESQMQSLVYAMSIMENGNKPMPDEGSIDDAYFMFNHYIQND